MCSYRGFSQSKQSITKPRVNKKVGRSTGMRVFYIVLVKDSENERGELGRVALREELLVDADKALQ